MHRYQILVAWSSEDEALENARDAIRLYLDVLSESGDSIPEPRE